MLRLPGKRNRRPGNPDEPVCIALSSDEEGGDEDENSRSSTAEQAGDQQGRRVGLEEQGRISSASCCLFCTDQKFMRDKVGLYMTDNLENQLLYIG